MVRRATFIKKNLYYPSKEDIRGDPNMGIQGFMTLLWILAYGAIAAIAIAYLVAAFKWLKRLF